MDTPKMNKLKNKINCPMVKALRLLKRIAKTSVPSKQPPHRIVIPTPNPKLIPPKRITNIGLCVMTGKFSNRCVPNDRTRIAKRLSIKNLLPRNE